MDIKPVADAAPVLTVEQINKRNEKLKTIGNGA